ncbi:MAG: hypothetical protein AABX11_06985 [Nanoarchaeota archaeon]
MFNKRGDDTNPTAFLIGFVIVIIVAGIIIFSFSEGARDSFKKFFASGGGKDTVSLVSTSCKLLCEQGTADNYAGYCGNMQDIVYNKASYNSTCNNLQSGKTLNGTVIPGAFPKDSFVCASATC